MPAGLTTVEASRPLFSGSATTVPAPSLAPAVLMPVPERGAPAFVPAVALGALVAGLILLVGWVGGLGARVRRRLEPVDRPPDEATLVLPDPVEAELQAMLAEERAKRILAGSPEPAGPTSERGPPEGEAAPARDGPRAMV